MPGSQAGKKVLFFAGRFSYKTFSIRTFVFTGGEPLLREDLFELIAYAKSRGFAVFIATNGTLITKEVAKLLRKYNVGVVIGLDGMNPEVHDSIRGVEGAYDAVIAGIGNCIAENYFIYNFIPFGRGEEIQEYAYLSPP